MRRKAGKINGEHGIPSAAQKIDVIVWGAMAGEAVEVLQRFCQSSTLPLCLYRLSVVIGHRRPNGAIGQIAKGGRNEWHNRPFGIKKKLTPVVPREARIVQFAGRCRPVPALLHSKTRLRTAARGAVQFEALESSADRIRLLSNLIGHLAFLRDIGLVDHPRVVVLVVVRTIRSSSKTCKLIEIKLFKKDARYEKKRTGKYK